MRLNNTQLFNIYICSYLNIFSASILNVMHFAGHNADENIDLV